MSVGEKEYSVIHRGSTRDEVESYFGQPIEAVKLDLPMSIKDIRDKLDHFELPGFPAVKNDEGEPVVTYPEVPATSQLKYSYSGRIQRKHDVGEAVALAGYTWGLSELFMVPTALKMQADRSNQTHFVTVWYGESDTALFTNGLQYRSSQCHYHLTIKAKRCKSGTRSPVGKELEVVNIGELTMNETFDQAWEKIAAIIAVLITGFISLVGILIAKDQKITEFRQVWIDKLRDELAILIGHYYGKVASQSIINLLQSKDKDGEALKHFAEVVEPDRLEFRRSQNRIHLLLNPKEHEDLIEAVDQLVNSTVEGTLGTTDETLVTNIIQLSQKDLKTEWERVKGGECSYRIVRVAAVIIFSVGLLGLVFTVTVR